MSKKATADSPLVNQAANKQNKTKANKQKHKKKKKRRRRRRKT